MIADYKTKTLEIFRFAFRPHELARCYRNLGYFFIERDMYKEAVCCYIFSLKFEHSEMVQSELYYISSHFGIEITEPTVDDIKACFAQNDIPFGPDHDVLGIAYHMGKSAFEAGAYDAARYYLSIFSQFIEDDKVEQMLKEVGPGEDE